MSGFSQIKREPEYIPQPTEDTVVCGNPFDDPPSRGTGPVCPSVSSLGSFGTPVRYPSSMMTLGPRGLAPGPPSLNTINGRVYPSDQPLIFSSTNPNAPPIFPCGTCHREIHDNDQAIQCESGCNFWFHRVCIGLHEDAFNLLNAEPCAEWVCDNCWMQKTVPLVKFKP